MAHVHCVVVGFSTAPNVKPKKIFDDDKVSIVDNINFYLTDGENVFVEAHTNHIQKGVPKMTTGSKPADGGNLIIEADDLDYFLNHEPAAEKYIRPLLGAEEFIKGKKRYCLWLEDVPLDEIKKIPLIDERVEACRQFRLQSKKAVTRESATTPHLFQQNRQPKTNYIVVPETSSGERDYVPIDFTDSKIIATNSLHIIPDAEIYHFGILTSSIHMAWVRTVAGYLGTSYRYSAKVVYNNFPWCEVTARQRRLIERSAQNILDVRKDFPDWTFAKLYDETTMPDELRSAHKWNDFNVALAYGFEAFVDDEAKVVAELMKLYKALTS